MVGLTVHTLGILFAIIGGTGAGLLALLCWRVFRESPFGTTIALLSVTMSGMIIYHVILFALARDSLLLDTVWSALYTVLAIFMWLLIVTHHQIEDTVSEGVGTRD